MKKIVYFAFLIVLLLLNYLLFDNIRATIKKMFVGNVTSKARIIEETSNSIFDLINSNEQEYIADRYKIVTAADINSILNRSKRFELMLNYDVKDIALIKNGKFVIRPRENSLNNLLSVNNDTIFIKSNKIFIINRYGNWIKVFVFDMESIDVENDTLSFGAFLRKIRDKSGTIYFIWQDTRGIIAATGNITKVSSIDADTFLVNALESGFYKYRFITFEGKRGVEVVKRINKEDKQLLRICFDATPLYAGERKVFLMFMISSFLILIIAVALYTLLYNKKAMKKMEEENMFNREVIRNLFNGMESPLVIFDEEGHIELKNRLYDKICSQVTGKDFLSNLEKNDTLEISGRLYSVFLSDINVEGKRNKYKLAILMDRTDRIYIERMQEERKRKEEDEEFIAEFAHKVKNPLNAISMATQRLLSNKKFDGELVEIIHNEISVLNKNIGDFLKKIRQRGNVCINDILSDICKLYSVEAEEKGIVLKCTIPEEQFYLPILREDITGITDNLIKNAIESFDYDVKEPRYIEVSLGKENGSVVITVSDNGKPMDESSIDRLFRKGYTEKKNGSGLGLYVVKKTVEKYGGTVEIKNRDVKSFIVTIPIQ